MAGNETEDFLKLLKHLNCPEYVSNDSFRRPNFPLVSRLLVWFTRLFDPEAQFEANISTEDGRIRFITSVAEFLTIKARIKLNLKRIYKADHTAVFELSKIATILKNAIDYSQQNHGPLSDLDYKFFTDNKAFYKKTKELDSNFSNKTVTLIELLHKEHSMKESRRTSLDRKFSFAELGDILLEEVKKIHDETNQVEQLIKDCNDSLESVAVKIANKSSELDRYNNRIQALKKIKPMYSNEYNEMEFELRQYYEQYSTKYRNLLYLEKKFNDISEFERKKCIEHELEWKKTVSIESIETDDELLSSYQMAPKNYDSSEL